jgi:thioredoxin-dependent peroxiredoxin
VYGISKDGLKSHQKFKENNQLPFELISDKDKVLHEAYEVLKEKSMFGKKVLGTERSTFVIDENGRVVKEFRGVKSKGHADEVLEYLKG